MIVFLNGQFVPEERAVVSVFDRAFRYGDGLFEAVLALNGKLFRWPQHFQRLACSAQILRFPLPCSSHEMEGAAHELLRRNQMRDAVLRVQLSRGIGPRGYAPTGEEKPLIVMSLHPAPPRTPAAWKLTVCSLRAAADDPLANHKTCSRLLQVMAASEARARRADEALLVNTRNEITEGSTSNVFWIQHGTVCTPPLNGLLPGITRATVLELCDGFGIPRAERAITPAALLQSDGVFLSLTTRGIVEAAVIDDATLGRSPITQRLTSGFESLLQKECSPG
jgi:aminodeoxychorismate lyase